MSSSKSAADALASTLGMTAMMSSSGATPLSSMMRAGSCATIHAAPQGDAAVVFGQDHRTVAGRLESEAVPIMQW